MSDGTGKRSGLNRQPAGRNSDRLRERDVGASAQPHDGIEIRGSTSDTSTSDGRTMPHGATQPTTQSEPFCDCDNGSIKSDTQSHVCRPPSTSTRKRGSQKRSDNTEQSRADDSESGSARKLLPLMYDELRRLAAYYLRSERPDHTLQPTALVHEAYMRLMHPDRSLLLDRHCFFGLAAQTIRRVLVDHARWRQCVKRGGGEQTLHIEDHTITRGERIDVVALDDALLALERIHKRAAHVVELRYFGGMSTQEVASLLDISERTVERDWKIARAWLYRELTGQERPEGGEHDIDRLQ